MADGLRCHHFVVLLLLCLDFVTYSSHGYDLHQPLSKIAIHKTILSLRDSASIRVSPSVLGVNGEDTEWLTVKFEHPEPSMDDWIGVFSPAKFNSSICLPENYRDEPPYICSAPIKVCECYDSPPALHSVVPHLVFRKSEPPAGHGHRPRSRIMEFHYANYSNSNYIKTGKSSLKFQLINQRQDFSFALFSGNLSNPILVAVSNVIKFAYPNAPLYPRIAQGRSWNEMTVTWTSGYAISEAVPLIEWGREGENQIRSPAGTLTFDQNSMCGSPARTVGWRDPGFIHTSFLRNLWPNSRYTYRLGHLLLSNGSYIWSKSFSFRSSPYPGQDSLQRVIIFGDMGKGERDGSNECGNYQPGSLNTTDQLIKDVENIDIVFNIGDVSYANGYISGWDRFTSQVEPIASAVPYMIASGNHERDWPNTGSFYENLDSGGECGVVAETMFYVPAENRAKPWYSTDYGMFHFCVADSEHDWREGSEQYRFIEKCLASVDRHKQPWLIFAAHRVLGYSSNEWYSLEGSSQEPMGREGLQKLWQKYRVDIAFYGHVHNYERTCPIYQNQCVNAEKGDYSGTSKGTIHVVAGGGGSHLSSFSDVIPSWSIYRDFDFGFVKLTSFNRSYLLFEYKKSRDGQVYDSFTISRDYKDVLACVHDSCAHTTLAS